jgi:hypothetical protein
LIWFDFWCFNATLNNISAISTSFSGGGSGNTRREPPIMGKQLVNFITCDCELSAPFVIYSKNISKLGNGIADGIPVLFQVPRSIVIRFQSL